jgi:drug/metabolite transporter (DMT)-like permease
MASFLFAVQILLLDRYGRRVRSNYLTVGFLGMTGGLALVLNLFQAVFGPGLGNWLAWLGNMLCQPAVVCDLLLLTLLCTVLAFHLMNVYQPRVSAGRAALVYLLEPVFASAFSIAWGYDPLSWRLLLGGCLILGGNLIIEVPFWALAKPPKTLARDRPDAEK